MRVREGGLCFLSIDTRKVQFPVSDIKEQKGPATMTNKSYHVDPNPSTEERPNGFVAMMPFEMAYFAEHGASGSTAAIVYLTIKWHARPDKLEARPSKKRIMGLTGLSDRTVKSAIRIIEDAWFVDVERSPGRRTNRYIFDRSCWPNGAKSAPSDNSNRAKSTPLNSSNGAKSTLLDTPNGVKSTPEVDVRVDQERRVDQESSSSSSLTAKGNGNGNGKKPVLRTADLLRHSMLQHGLPTELLGGDIAGLAKAIDCNWLPKQPDDVVKAAIADGCAKYAVEMQQPGYVYDVDAYAKHLGQKLKLASQRAIAAAEAAKPKAPEVIKIAEEQPSQSMTPKQTAASAANVAALQANLRAKRYSQTEPIKHAGAM